MASHPVADIQSVSTGRFIIPIPKLEDGLGPLELPNAKEVESVIKSGAFGSAILSATLEGFPQVVPTDGSQIVVINDITRHEAIALQSIYDAILEEHGGKMDRNNLMEFIHLATGIAYDPQTRSINLVPDNIGIRGDVYNMSMQTFKERHNRYGSDGDLTTVPNEQIKTGYYQKKQIPAQGFTISGGFKRRTESGTEQIFPEKAMIALASDGLVSAIHHNDITVSYEGADGSTLVDANTQAIKLPNYPVGQVLLTERGAPPRDDFSLGKE
ncbi:MAG: hypothetical protein SFT92_00810 [Rickettsiales bacterium]|nr:hypothetical protein [Rickettsiales bacterium]